MSTRKLSTFGLLGSWVRDLVNGRVYNPVSTDDFILGGNSTEWVTGTELKMFFDQSKGALSGGSINSTGRDDSNRGTASIAWGDSTTRATNTGCVALGTEAQATGIGAVAIGGGNPVASAASAVALGGGTASGAGSFTATGNGTVASGQYSVAFGGGGTAAGTKSVMFGSFGAATRYGQFTHNGGLEVQYNRFLAAVTTTNATPAVPTFDQAAVALTGNGTNVLTITVSKAHKFTVQVIARATNADAFASWEIKGSIVRYSSGNARFISTPVVTADKEAAASAWDCAVSVNTSNATNNYLTVTVTGAAATTIKWAVCIETVEFP